MLEIVTSVEIGATPQRVWSVLMDFAEHPSWNPFLRSIEGIPKVGERLKVSIQPVGGRAMVFRPTILVLAPAQELRWLGRLLLPGIFDGEHYFRIIPIDSNRVRFEHGERFSGILVPLAKSSLTGGTKAGFMAMNEALKARSEGNEP